MPRRSAVVAGASIAGPTLAYWLNRYGWRTTIVERWPALRTGGLNIDLRGPGLEVMARMGVEGQVRAASTGELGLEFVDSRGRVVARFPVGDKSGLSLSAEVEILRGDLVELLAAATPDTEYRFGDRITSIEQGDDGVALVTFEQGSEEQFDLVVAADGLGSSTRGLVFDDEDMVRGLGVEATWATIPRTPSDTEWWRLLIAPGGTLSLRPDPYGTTRTVLTRTMTAEDRRRGRARRTPDEQRELLRRIFGGAGWEATRILDALEDVGDLYFETVGQVRPQRWSRGCVVLVGDAAYCPSGITGLGTTLAVVGAYVLAGEIAAHTALRDGLASYERVLRPWIDKVQKLPPGVPRIANPTSPVGVTLLQTLLRAASSPPGRILASKLTRGDATAHDFDLPQYDHLET